MTQKQTAARWIKTVFDQDINKEYNDGFDRGYLCIMPSMEIQSFMAVYNHYTGEEIINNSKEGTAHRVYMELSKFVNHFFNVIDPEKSDFDNINAMITETIKENRGALLIAYFCLCQERIKYPNFVDIRMVFHNLYKAYIDSYDPEKNMDDRENKLKAIRDAVAKFEKFHIAQEAKETKPDYVKEFFNG
jgi:hypothetical protein